MKIMFQLAAWLHGVYYFTKTLIVKGKIDTWFLEWPQ
jgi:hypothetical protein